jgi:hypothetical protein
MNDCEFKIGDKVRVVRKQRKGDSHPSLWRSSMDVCVGNTYIVLGLDKGWDDLYNTYMVYLPCKQGDGFKPVGVEENGWWFPPETLELVDKQLLFDFMGE